MDSIIITASLSMPISWTLPNLLPNDWVWSQSVPGLYFYPFSRTDSIIHSLIIYSCDEYLFSTTTSQVLRISSKQEKQGYSYQSLCYNRRNGWYMWKCINKILFKSNKCQRAVETGKWWKWRWGLSFLSRNTWRLESHHSCPGPCSMFNSTSALFSLDRCH